MPKLTTTVLLALLVAACSDAPRPTAPPAAGESSLASVAGGSDRIVSMLDACDPATFNAAIGDGTCTRTGGGVTFEQFSNGSIGAWRFAPGTMNVAVGQTLLAINRGGEEHTFTEVEHFGGGFLPFLNQLSGNPVPAPECLNIRALEFIEPGEIHREKVGEDGTELYQCCIHPWMRVTVHANHGS